eukprot:s6119_g1.t1
MPLLDAVGWHGRTRVSFQGLDALPAGAKAAGQAKPGAGHDPGGAQSMNAQKQKETMEMVQEAEGTAGMHVNRQGANALMGPDGFDPRLADPARRWCLPARSPAPHTLPEQHVIEAETVGCSMMEVEEDGPGGSEPSATAEQRLASLKPYVHLAWDECKQSAEQSAAAQLRWEVFSTWMLLSCLALAEAERERLAQCWQPKAWTSETIALRHLFMESHSVRALGAVLRWLRWSHRWAPQAHSSVEAGFVYTAGYDRTRRALQLHGGIPAPFQEGSLHPDGPLQHGEKFQCADIEDERQLLADLWTCLRRGELGPALKLCAESGQAWRTTLLQGMLPFCEEPAGEYESSAAPGPDETVEEMLAFMKEEHSDWTDFGQLPQTKGSQGNPWRRVWKDECFDAAARNLLPGSKMDLKELSIYGFCSGNYDALMPSCSAGWADRCFGEFHCLKELGRGRREESLMQGLADWEWLVERLLEDGQARRCRSGDGDGIEGCWPHLGEGDLCAEEDSAEDRALRTAKLCGRLTPSLSPDVEAAVKQEVLQLLQRALPREDTGWEAASDVSQRFGQLQTDAENMASAFAAQKDLDVHVDRAGNFRVSSGCGNNLTLGMEAFQARAQQADKLGGTAAGVCLPASHSGAITLTCAGLADLDDDEESKISTCSIGVDNLKNRAWSADDCGEPMGKTLTESTEAPSEPWTPESANLSRDEPRQLLMLLSSRRVAAVLRETLQLLDPKAEAFLSQRKVLKVLAEVHFVWKVRHAWAAQPEESTGPFIFSHSQWGPEPAIAKHPGVCHGEESWGSFLQGTREGTLGLVGSWRLGSRSDGPEDWSDMKSMFLRLPASALSKMARLIAGAWDVQQGQAALEMLRGWLRDPRPAFVLKQFAAFFAVWQKEALEEQLRVPVDVDDIVGTHVSELLMVASGPLWEERCLRDQALEVILEHCKVLQPEPRREAFASVLLRLGRSAGTQAVAEAAAPRPELCFGSFAPWSFK